MQHKSIGSIISNASGLGPRSVRLIASTESPDRGNGQMAMPGCRLNAYLKNNVVLFNHQPDCPVGNAQVEIKSGRLEALVTFAPEGASDEADEVCSLAKAGVLKGVSIGFLPIVQEPLEGGGYKIKEWELLEISIVAIGMNAEALVVQRSMGNHRAKGAINGDHDYELRQRQIEVLELKHSPHYGLSPLEEAAVRRYELARLTAKGKQQERDIRNAFVLLPPAVRPGRLPRPLATPTYRPLGTAQAARAGKDLSSSTKNTMGATFRIVLKVARDDGVINAVPKTPRTKQKDNPRPFLRFYPLVEKRKDGYQVLLRTVREMANDRTAIRGVAITEELHDIIVFVTHSFVRPTTTELYALRHAEIQVAENPSRLVFTVRNGKTGYRIANSMEAAVDAYRRVRDRHPDAHGEDYVFLPGYANRTTAARVIQRQFNAALERAGIKHDPFTGMDHTVYSLRHTAICMRIILSQGDVNIFNLAKNAGTSVEQIERFYPRNLPLSAEMARNLQTFGKSPIE
ncbi:MAG: HK97 family phage prohead protease [Methylocystis sp.]|uniref:HK97 family phage prohead protease n=1 Tax=Methylocystis sp. TaxID=1911079 RepID=UPI003DA24510